MRNIFDPLQLRCHLFLFLLILLILLVLIDPIFFELVFDFIDLLVEEPTDVWFLLDEDLWGFILDWGDIVDDFFMEFVDLDHSIPVIAV